jgi:S-formylglutathione hydrolase FrmB
MPSPPHHEPPGLWTTIEIAGRACDLYEPRVPRQPGAVVYLHDAGEAPPFPESPLLRAALAEAGLIVLAPRTGPSWWLDRVMPAFDRAVTPERFVVEHVRGALEQRFGIRPPGIALVGTGMGGQGALRISYRHPAVFPVAAAIAPAIDFHVAMREIDLRDDATVIEPLWEAYGDVERARQDTAILHVHPLNWPRHQWFASDPSNRDWHDGAVRLDSKLRALGIPHTALLSNAASDDSATPMAQAVRFVVNALEQESRRLA